MPSHTHGLSDITGGAHSTHSGTTDGMTSGTGGSTTAHTHDIGQSLTGGSHTHDMTSTPTLTITGYGTSGEPENIEGHTGGLGILHHRQMSEALYQQNLIIIILM